jgi:hypothetical protein
MKTVILTKNEFDYLINNLLKDKSHLVKKIQVTNLINEVCLYLDENVADDVRELAGSEVGLHFDNDYMPTKEGEILENLIDKFY